MLQPRNLAANAQIPWTFDARPSPPHILADLRGLPASPGMQKALRERKDVLVELHDIDGAYVSHLSPQQRSIITVDSRTRLEQMLAKLVPNNDVYVLPDPQALLCPQKLRSIIEKENDDEYRVLLFCLYQASHNHDARTLYPLRFQGNNEPDMLKLRRDLMRSCCSNSVNHDTACSAKKKSAEAVRDQYLLLSTHEAFIHQEQSPQAQLIVVDDLAELQMHLASLRASKVDSEWLKVLQLTSAEQEAFALLRTQMTICIKAYVPQPGFHERLALHSLIRYLREMPVQDGRPKLSILKSAGNTTRLYAEEFERLCKEASQEPVSHISPTDERTLEDDNISQRSTRLLA